MKNILFISMYPFPVDMGSKQHAYYFLKSLAGKYNVYCIFFIPPHKAPPGDVAAHLTGLGVKAYDICQFEPPSNNRRYLKLLKSWIAFPNAFMNAATHENGMKTISRYIKEYHIDAVHFEHFWLTQYVFKIPAHLKKVIVYHDLHHAIFKQRAVSEKKYRRKLDQYLLFLKFYIFEHLLEKSVDLKIFLNPVEMRHLPKNSVHIPHIVNPDIRYKPARKTDAFNILFLGAYSHPPNRCSVEYIVRDILPCLAKSPVEFKIHIVGPGTENFQPLIDGSPYRDRILIHGFKPEINDAFDKMDIALFPILNGGGIKTKIIDALTAGVPVVTTSKGVEGLDHLTENCARIGNTPEELTHEMITLMGDFPLRMKNSKIGRIFIDKQHSYNAFSRMVIDAYAAL
jgi:glycosyltransferase involved in cell wall biosynthesis